MNQQNETKQEFQVGQLVQVKVRTGIYIGEVYEIYSPRLVVTILAVLKHPEQGDLHHPRDPDVPLFHERRALSYTEKTTVLPRDVQLYAGEVPDYKQSLLYAVKAELDQLKKLNRWTAQSITILDELMESYSR